LAIAQLKATDNFYVIEFNSYAQNLWKLPRSADSNNKEDAKHFVNSLSANGGTEMQSALKLAFPQFKTHTSSTFRQIVFITDGSVGNEESLMQLISHKLKDSRLLTKLQQPAITDIELQIDANKLQSNRQLEFYPNVISDRYKGEPLVLSYRLTDDKIDSSLYNQGITNHNLSKVNILAQYQGKPWGNPLTLSTQHSNQTIRSQCLWAREKISQLTIDKRRANMRTNSSAAEQDEYKSQITKTALAHHLVSQYTSLIAIDVTPFRPVEIQSINKKVTNPLPKGTSNKLLQSHGSLPKTATSAQLRIIIGIILIGLAIWMHIITKIKAKSQNDYP
jgi:Ca-activated chloride channel family protein